MGIKSTHPAREPRKRKGLFRSLRDEQFSSQRPHTWVPRPHNCVLPPWPDFGARFVRPEHALCHARHERIVAPPEASLLGRFGADRDGSEQMQTRSTHEQIKGLYVHSAERKKQRNRRIARVRELVLF